VYAPSSNPLASFTLPPNVIRNTVVTFDAGGSTPEQGAKVAHYGWDFDQDGNYDVLSDIAVLTHIFSEPGPTSLALQVIDDRGLTSDWVSQSFEVLP
jgi:PKD repeat protein